MQPSTRNRWIFSDIHFGHRNIIRFTKQDGTLIRPGFHEESGKFVPFEDDISFHDEMYIRRHNERVAPHDHVYFLGDFGKPLSQIHRLNGKFRLVPGNHDDIHSMTDLDNVFEKIYPDRRMWPEEEFGYPVVFTHSPIHMNCDYPTRRRINVHGHIHEKVIRRDNGSPDPWYINVSVEQLNHAPISWDQLRSIVAHRVTVLKQLGEIT